MLKKIKKTPNFYKELYVEINKNVLYRISKNIKLHHLHILGRIRQSENCVETEK